MKTFWLASCLAVLTGLAFAAPQSNACHPSEGAACAAASSDECPASALIVKWEQATEQLAAMPAATHATVAEARATLAASCPVCQQAPATFSFLGRFFDATAALDGLALAACKDGSKCDAPEEIRDAFAERVAIGAKARELHAALTRAMNAETQSHAREAEGTTAPAELTFATSGKGFETLIGEAGGLVGNWSGIPARAAALPASTKAQLFQAMEVVQREVPTCDLAKETMTVLVEGVERLVALDAILGEHCQAIARTEPAELQAERALPRKAFQERASATVKVALLLRVMKKTMTPEIFQDDRTTVVAESSR